MGQGRARKRRDMAMVDTQTYDLLVIGGGINGAGIARDAAGRGLAVMLVEQDDLASHTSSSSTKLIHGGLRYLESFAFRLVREALIEREVLLCAAPHIIWPMRFVLPHVSDLRPAWMIRTGLFLYDHLGGRELLPGSHGINFRTHEYGGPLKPGFKRGFVYSDCWVQDSRLVVLNAMDAAMRGADIRTRTKCTALDPVEGEHGPLWEAGLECANSGTTETIRARAVANAAGPWVTRMLDIAGDEEHSALRLVKGSHIIVKKRFEGDQAYIFQHTDGRIVFAIPYEGEYTLIGTTDIEVKDDPGKVEISNDEINYLCAAVNRYLQAEIGPDDVVETYSGVRPLLDDGERSASKVTRDYTLELDDVKGAPILSVFGGKITTFRMLAEHAMEKLLPVLDRDAPGWTRNAHLPGGDIEDADFGAFFESIKHAYPFLPPQQAFRMCRAYGTRIHHILDGAKGLGALGKCIGGDLYAAEVDYLCEQEWAQTPEDILWRRSKLALHISAEAQDNLAAYLEKQDKHRKEA